MAYGAALRLGEKGDFGLPLANYVEETLQFPGIEAIGCSHAAAQIDSEWVDGGDGVCDVLAGETACQEERHARLVTNPPAE